LILEQQVLKKIRALAEKAYPEECCGLLVTTLQSKTVTDAVPMRNSAESRTNRYLLDPLEFMRADDEVSKKGGIVAGIYHSHPDHPPIPSEYDREHAFPGLFYLILSVSKGRAEEARAWILAPNQTIFNEEPLQVAKS
jgi:proteasome lid subunit RPN8/RPN11